jgi:hypothetical protein
MSQREYSNSEVSPFCSYKTEENSKIDLAGRKNRIHNKKKKRRRKSKMNNMEFIQKNINHMVDTPPFYPPEWEEEEMEEEMEEEKVEIEERRKQC